MEGGSAYRLSPNQPPEEARALPPGTLARCEQRSLDRDRAPTATAIAD
jgi:hypothetical protein